MGFKDYINTIRLAKENKRTLVNLDVQTKQLTQKDIGAWRKAWQMAITIENPNRMQLYNMYSDTLIDNHLSGAIEQRKDMVLQKAFKLCDKNGKENPVVTEVFESKWFKDFLNLSLDSVYWGHSLIQLGEPIDINGKRILAGVYLVPRHHVVPEYGVIVANPSDEWKKGYPYREGQLAKWCIEAGTEDNLGILLKVTPQAISKRYMLSYWDVFGEVFGCPIRIAKTNTRDAGERKKIYDVLAKMGFLNYAVIPEGTEIELKETNRSDAFNVYDRRVERANDEMSKAVLGQTMTLDNGSSKSQGEVHLEILKNIINQDADFIRDLVNDKLIPKLILEHGFSNLSGYVFNWDETIDYTPDQQAKIEDMLLNNYEVDPNYFAEKYNIKILGSKEKTKLSKGFFD